MTNLVMGAAKGYGWDVLEPFVTSCKRHCPDAEIVLFIGDISDFTRDKLNRAGVRLEHFPDEPRGIPNNTRWKFLGDWLEAYGDDFAQVFITDTRDVVFQADIFAPFSGLTNWLGLATEADDIRGSKSNETTNYGWISDCFGAAEAERLADQKIICSGTVIGSIDAMKIFCRELWKILEHKTTRIFDQAVTNYLAWNGLLPIENVFELDTDGGEIFTSYIFHTQHPIEIRDDKILRGDGGIPAVLHQYDRHDALVELVDKIYRDRDFQADPRFSDVQSVVEQTVCLLYADKVADAAKLFMRKFLSSADFNAAKNSLVTVWELAAKKNFSPTVELLELAAQSALTSVKKFSDAQMFGIHKIFLDAEKNCHAIDPTFKKNFVARLLEIGERNLAAGAPISYAVHCVRLIEELGAVPDENILRFAARVNQILEREFGGKKF